MLLPRNQDYDTLRLIVKADLNVCQVGRTTVNCTYNVLWNSIEQRIIVVRDE